MLIPSFALNAAMGCECLGVETSRGSMINGHIGMVDDRRKEQVYSYCQGSETVLAHHCL